jgi:uncharacterized protein YndB with AHSA1/START domain
MSRTFDTQIVVDAQVPLVRIVREFDAPPAKVFVAHTEPDLVVRWNGPNGTAMRIDHWDCRNGGSYRYLHVIDGEEYGFRGCFHEVRPNELIVQTFTFEGMPNGVALEKLILEDVGNGRTRLTATRRLRCKRHGTRRPRKLRAPRHRPERNRIARCRHRQRSTLTRPPSPSSRAR